ncbi:MAG: protein translocase SEC61 complex subunit gamma [archaeon]
MNPVENVSKFLDDARRIFYVSKKPNKEEFKRIAIITALGIVIIGMMGYIIYLIFAISGIGA